ncbi:dipeptide ABC transporter ATP-binding protein [Streptomyces sp. NPDC056716]|uniref:dipeptide ABC transporter ATP-binding protein n=1 Tax=unclassified Streptomyces TaxID=2593676 RepID=UPI0036811D4E
MSVTESPLLSVEGLDVSFGRGEPVRAVRDVSFSLRRGECLAVVGESGSGKSVTARTLLGLTGARARVAARRLVFDGVDLTALSEREWRSVRGRRIGLVLQDALVSLDPLRTVGAEIRETLATHRLARGAEARERTLTLLSDAGIPDPARRAAERPHQLSGGLRQRALIASALSGAPELLVADEPTTALDVTVQAQILDLLGRLVGDGTALLLISHDLAVVARLADRVAVMYGGLLVEQGPAQDVLKDPRHPYTRALLAAVPTFASKGGPLSVPSPPGQPAAGPDGCPYAARCPAADDRCRTKLPAATADTGGHLTLCWYPDGRSAGVSVPGAGGAEVFSGGGAAALLDAASPGRGTAPAGEPAPDEATAPSGSHSPDHGNDASDEPSTDAHSRGGASALLDTPSPGRRTAPSDEPAPDQATAPSDGHAPAHRDGVSDEPSTDELPRLSDEPSPGGPSPLSGTPSPGGPARLSGTPSTDALTPLSGTPSPRTASPDAPSPAARPTAPTDAPAPDDGPAPSDVPAPRKGAVPPGGDASLLSTTRPRTPSPAPTPASAQIPASARQDAGGALAKGRQGAQREPLLDVQGVSKTFRSADGGAYRAVADVSFQIMGGETLGLVGESGSGKTTTAQMVLGLVEPDEGVVRFEGEAWSGVPERERRARRSRLQVVHQDPLGSFDPRHDVRRILAEAVARAGVPRGRARTARVAELLGQVGLSAALEGRRPLELSGGQRQRVAIARALATGPRLIVCDEPVSALDVSIQAQVLDLLADLQRELGVALLFISHDLGVVHHVSDRVVVMKDGRLVESGPVAQIFANPRHPYTRELLTSLPRPERTQEGRESRA